MWPFGRKKKTNLHVDDGLAQNHNKNIGPN
jgi:hypothetical protein